jgi:ABC-2 type transport system permease protein
MFYIGFAAMAVLCLIMAVGFHKFDFRHLQRTANQFFKGIDFKKFVNGTMFCAMCVSMGIQGLMPIFAALVGGQQIAGEAKEGTLRSMLCRPVHRWEVFTSKFAVSCGYLALLLAFMYGIAAAIGLLVFRGGNLLVYGGAIGRHSIFPVLLQQGIAFERLLLACGLAWVAMLVLMTLALMFSALFESPVSAIVWTLSLFFIFRMVGEIPYFASIKPYLFTTHTDLWLDVFQTKIPWMIIRDSAAWCGIYTAGFLAGGLLTFQFKDVRS